MGVYTLDGIPSDLITNQREYSRALKIDSSIGAISKTISYNIDGTVDSVTEINEKTGETVVKQFAYTNGKLVGVTANIQ